MNDLRPAALVLGDSLCIACHDERPCTCYWCSGEWDGLGRAVCACVQALLLSPSWIFVPTGIDPGCAVSCGWCTLLNFKRILGRCTHLSVRFVVLSCCQRFEVCCSVLSVPVGVDRKLKLPTTFTLDERPTRAWLRVRRGRIGFSLPAFVPLSTLFVWKVTGR